MLWDLTALCIVDPLWFSLLLPSRQRALPFLVLPRYFPPPCFVRCTPVVREPETLFYDYPAYLSAVDLLIFDVGNCARQFVVPSVDPASALEPPAPPPRTLRRVGLL